MHMFTGLIRHECGRDQGSWHKTMWGRNDLLCVESNARRLEWELSMGEREKREFSRRRKKPSMYLEREADRAMWRRNSGENPDTPYVGLGAMSIMSFESAELILRTHGFDLWVRDIAFMASQADMLFPEEGPQPSWEQIFAAAEDDNAEMS